VRTPLNAHGGDDDDVRLFGLFLRRREPAPLFTSQEEAVGELDKAAEFIRKMTTRRWKFKGAEGALAYLDAIGRAYDRMPIEYRFQIEVQAAFLRATVAVGERAALELHWREVKGRGNASSQATTKPPHPGGRRRLVKLPYPFALRCDSFPDLKI
jgi:hypothetical protein